MVGLSLVRRIVVSLGVFAMVCGGLQRNVQAQAKAMITAPVDESQLLPLRGSVSGRLKGATDLGAADGSKPSGRMLLLMKRSQEQEASLQSFLMQAHQRGSAQFHKWLKPSEFGSKYGAADADVQQATGWLQSHGLKVAGATANRSAIEFSGTIGQLNEAFHTSIHQYNVQGETHLANATEAKIPAALAAAVGGVSPLNDFRAKPLVKVQGRAVYDAKKHTGVGQWTYGEGQHYAPYYFLTPEDFATQYDVKPVYTAGTNGQGQTIGIINDSNIDLSLVNAYRKLFGLAANTPQVVIDGNDPGINGDSIEAYLDVENAGAVAPAATVKLYIAGNEGLLGNGGLSFSLLRAVNDDAATVLSLSFGTCEDYGTADNEFINSLWEQAAAQGQTVLVSTGDSGSLGCGGLGVNALASTPWDIGVGGTDAYFTDYAAGGASVSTFWSNTNDANLGSLQTKMTEQPWDGSLYGLNSIVYDPPNFQAQQEGAGGGGSSACAVTSSTAEGTVCVSGYPKPSWQVGTGVPNDGVRDLPDVSLFASNGYNGVLWPICAEAGDCTETDPIVNELYVTGVGGTSASAPAMAGIMALVNQKYGSQGQANVTLYPLAAQHPAAFNDVTMGSNNEPCEYTDFGCSLDANGTTYSLQVYSAGVGYDRASGLGTIDVNQMLTNWNSISFKSSATTLSLTPTTITHGQTVTADVAVTGTGTPAGAVGLVASTTLPNNKGLTYLQLGAGGTATEGINYLPGGTYTITAQYSGDGVNGVSASTPVSVTVNPEASALAFTPVFYGPYGQSTFITQNASVPYGDALLMDVAVYGSGGTQDGNATGTMTFTDGSTTLATVPVSAGGTAEFDASLLPVGTHSIGGSYSGDASYKAATFGPVTFTVVKGQAVLQVLTDSAFRFQDSTLNYYRAGESATAEALVFPDSALYGLYPTGTVSFQLGSNAPVTATLVPGQDLGEGVTSIASTVLSNLQAGNYTLTATYGGDANFLGYSGTANIVVAAGGGLLNSTSTLTLVSPTSLAGISPDTVITVLGTVTGSGTTAPTGSVVFALGNDVYFGLYDLTPGSGNSSSVELALRAADFYGGNNIFTMNYLGDTVYAASGSGPLTVPNDNTDFTLQTQTPNLAIASGNSGSATLNLMPLNGFTGAVGLTCAAPASMVCSVSSGSVTVSGSATTATVKITAAVTTTTAAERHGIDWRKTGGGIVLACLVLCVLPRRRRLGGLMLSLVAMAALLGGAGCGGSSSNSGGGGGGMGSNVTDTPKGTYTVVVTGTGPGGTIHNAAITVIVQ